MSRRLVVLILLSFGVLFGLSGVQRPPVADAQRVPPGGAPAAGSGPRDTSRSIRVIDGDTIETWLDGQQTGIGLIGINAARANDQCGMAAVGKMYSLVKQGLRLEEDTSITFDERGRRMYQAYTKDGALLAEEMVKSGFAKPGAQPDRDRRAPVAGKETGKLAAAASDAAAANRGCSTKFEPSTRDALNAGAQDTLGASAAGGPALGIAMPMFNVRDVLGSAGAALDPRGLLVPSSVDAATTMPQGFTQDVVAEIDTVTMGQPTNFAFLPDGRILITLKNGMVKLVKNGALQTAPFIDLRDRVNDYWDHGLLGVAVDPNFATNGYVYFTYTYENDAGNHAGLKTARVARYTTVGDAAATASELVLVGSVVGNSCNDFPMGSDCIPSDSPSHSVGTLNFASDGSLFITLGDGAHFNFVDDNALRAQNLDSLSGKMLRINPANGQGYADNPFATGSLSANRSKVWALGLRNPYRFNINPATNVPVFGDVGWNTWEKVSSAPKGANLGWPCYEANVRQAGYEPKSACQTLYSQGQNAVWFALDAWEHGGGSSAATGGAFYEGTAYPSALQGAYFYADYGKNFFRTLKIGADNKLVAGSVAEFATGADAPVAIEAGPDQNIYYLSITTGQLRKIRYTVGNTPPTAVAAASPNSGLVPLAVQFSSAGTVDPDGDPLTYSWNFGDGTPVSTSPNPSHTYTTNGTFTATLTVTDSRGADAHTTIKVGAGNRPPVPVIGSPNASLHYKVGDVIAYAGSATDPEDGNLAASALSWQINIKHCPFGQCHTHPFQSATGQGGALVIPDHGDESKFEIILTATDSGGLYASTNLILEPQTVELTIATEPAWQRVVYDGDSGLSPLTRTTTVGSAHTIYSSSPQSGATFSAWSDGGAQQHNITVGATNTTLTAQFNVAPRSLSFSGNGAYAEAAHRADINPGGDWTIETWFKDETPGGYNHAPGYMILKEDTAFSGDIPYQMWIEWGTLFVGQRTAWTQQLVQYPLGSVSANQWHHAAATLQASTRTLRVYVDGVQVAQGTLPAITTTGNRGPLRIGGNVIPGQFWRGKLDDVRIWSVVRTPTDILASSQRQQNGEATGLAGYWTLNDGSGTIAADGAGEPQDLTLVGATQWSPDSPGAADTTPPALSAIAAGGLTSTAATITWTSDEPSDSQVEYGPTTSYGSSTTLNPALVASHSVALSNLQPNTTYHYRVKSKDGSAPPNLTTSADQTFTTVAPRTCPCTIWGTSATPGVAAQDDSNAIELGVKFRSDQAGYISGVRFYKGAGNSGTHIGSLWSSTGTRLAQATFSGESATGWQQVNFATPVAVTANTTYVASYFAPNGHYARDEGGFNAAGVDNAPLLALRDGQDGPNGLYAYGASSSFPNNSYNGTNYWVDVVFTTTPPAADTTPPTISGVGSAPSSTTATVAWTTNEPADSQVEYGTTTAYGSSTTLAPATVTGHSEAISGLTASTTYHYRVKSKDAAGNLATSGDFTFITTSAPAPPSCPCTVWPETATPAVASAAETNAVELGVKFRSDQAGYISGVRFYKGTANTGTHVGSLWNTAGQRLAQATFAGETASGWQQVSFATPVAVTANTTYIASYHAPNGGFAVTLDGLTSAVDRAPLHALGSAASGGNGLYRFGPSAFPDQTYQASNYWVDVVFSTTPPAPDTTPPTISGVQSSGVTGAAATIAWTTNEGSDSQVEYGTTTAYGASTAVNPAQVTSHSVTLSGLSAGTLYHYRVKSKDAAGNLATSGDFTFTTGAPPACPCSIWSTSATPTVASQADTNAVELGVKFRADSNGYIRGIRFYKGAANTGTHIGSLWSSTGTRLAQATFTGETATGWQTVLFATPVQVTAGTTYVASYHAPSGGYARNEFGFTDAGVDNGPLHALKSGVDGPNGLYQYGPAGTFPTNSYNATNYWVDVVYSTTP